VIFSDIATENCDRSNLTYTWTFSDSQTPASGQSVTNATVTTAQYSITVAAAVIPSASALMVTSASATQIALSWTARMRAVMTSSDPQMQVFISLQLALLARQPTPIAA
jgi:hypothetical protein